MCIKLKALQLAEMHIATLPYEVGYFPHIASSGKLSLRQFLQLHFVFILGYTQTDSQSQL